LGELKGKKIAVLGLSYKPDVDDLRESPAVKVACLLLQAGVEVCAYEPNKTDADIPGVNVGKTFQETVANVDAILLMVNHRQFQAIDPHEITSMTPARIAIDTANAWDSQKWVEAGFEVFRLGCKKEGIVQKQGL
jgi:UDP-N-acetyl-D-mannosaminuronic acid dehydrogenase